MNNRWRQQVDALMRLADADKRALYLEKSMDGAEMRLWSMAEKINRAAVIAGYRENPIKAQPVDASPEAIGEDARCEALPEEEREMFNALARAEEDPLRPAPITLRQQIVFCATLLVSALWVALLLKIAGWIALWLGVL